MCAPRCLASGLMPTIEYSKAATDVAFAIYQAVSVVYSGLGCGDVAVPRGLSTNTFCCPGDSEMIPHVTKG